MMLRDTVYYPERAGSGSETKVLIRVGVITGIEKGGYVIRAASGEIVRRCEDHCYTSLKDARREHPKD